MSTMNKEKLKGLQSFLKDDIWRVTEDEVSKSRGILYNAIKIATLSIREFTQGRILNKASALTYSTLLSIIPILAILFAIARGFGFSNLLETQFRSGLEGQSAAAETILGLIDSYLVHAKSGVFIGVGLVMLFWTILSLTYNIERTFNYIWQVKKPRTLYRKMTDYFSILLLLPLLITPYFIVEDFVFPDVYKMPGSFHRTFQRSYHLYVHHGEKHGGLRITGTPDEISGTPGSFHPDLGHVHGAVRLYAQY